MILQKQYILVVLFAGGQVMDIILSSPLAIHV